MMTTTATTMRMSADNAVDRAAKVDRDDLMTSRAAHVVMDKDDHTTN